MEDAKDPNGSRGLENAAGLPAPGLPAPEPPALGLPALGLAAAAAGALLVALAVGERAGLPSRIAWAAGFVLIAGAAIAVVAAVRTAHERIFFGRVLLLRPAGGGLLLGAVTAAAAFHLLRPGGSQDLVALALGCAAGGAAAHIVARLRRASPLVLGEAVRGEEGAPSLIQGLVIAAVGLLLALAAFTPARDAVMLLTGWGAAAASLAVALPPAAALAAAGGGGGGGRGAGRAGGGAGARGL